jgi:methyl-accepting chemotaxis protein
MIAFILIFAASLHDMTYIILHSNPFCWLVPYSYFCLLISIFIVLALEESLMYTDLQKKSTEIDGKNTTMKRIIQQIELVTKNLVHSSRNLEENIVKAVNVIRSSSRNNNLLSDRLLSQLQEIGNATIQIAAKMEIAMEKIPGAISNQTSAVEETNRAVSDMNNHIENILKNMVKTNEITQELSTIASSVRNIVLKSKDSIKLVAENSKFIGEILINIQEIVEESNFLSMNASIESAHAGIAGRGFSILANEIRELANKSKERLEMSQDRLNQMLKFINESITLSEEVTNQLLIIIEKSGTSAEMIEKITELMSNHRMESGNILKGAATLLQNTLTIKDMADNDQKEYESIKQVLSTLKESFVDMSNLLKNQVNSENNIRDAMDNIQEVLSNSLKAMDMLNESVKIAGNDQYQEQF